MEAQSSPHNDKPSSDLNDLFEELERERKQPKARVSTGPASSSAAQALLGSKPRRSAPPPPPSLRPAVAAPPSLRAATEAVAQPERIDDAELIEDDDADATGKRGASALDDLLPKYDAEIDDAPTIARASPLSLSTPIPSRPAPLPNRLAPPPSVRVPAPPTSGRASASPSSIARLSAPAAPLKSATDMPLPSKSSLPALTPPPSRRSLPAPSRPPAPASLQASSRPLPSAPPTSVPAASVVVAEPISRAPSSVSIPPVARSDSHAAAQQKGKGGLVFGALAAVAFIAIAGGAAYGFKDKLLAANAPQGGAIVVTAAGPNDTPVTGLRVVVDGKEACTTSPCRLSLSSGTHFVRAEAPGFVATADRAISIDRAETTLHIGLSPVDAAKPAAATTAAPAPEPTQPSTEPAPAEAAPVRAASGPLPAKVAVAAKTAPAAKKQSAEAAKPADKPAATGTGTLNINSIPMASVVLDGRPVGSTPIMGLAVSPGPHSVVFIHPEHGRKATGVQVEAGKTATAAVRF